MKPDIYTKAVLTVIAVALIAIAFGPAVHPGMTAQAQSAQFAGVQYSDGNFFDTRTGEVWVYQTCCNVGADSGKYVAKMKLNKLGQAMVVTK